MGRYGGGIMVHRDAESRQVSLASKRESGQRGIPTKVVHSILAATAELHEKTVEYIGPKRERAEEITGLLLVSGSSKLTSIL